MKRAGGLIVAVAVFAAACGSDSEGGGSGGSGATGGSGGAGGSGGSGGSGATGAVTGGGSGGVAGSSGSGGIAGGGGSGGAPIVRVNTCVGPSGAALSNAKLPPGYCAWTWADNVSQARGIKVDTDGNVLVVARGGNNVVALWDDDKDGVSGASERMTVAQAPNLNHGIVLHKGYLWASSSSTVYRWAYTPRQALGSSTPMITGIPASGHATRTLLFDANDYLYVTVGSAGNVDADSSRARVIRYKLSDLEAGPKTFGDGELFADGTRNEVGIALDPSGRVWGVENGVDNLSRSDLGGDIHNDNPGEELNLFDTPGKFHGYPYCWSEHSLGAQYAKGAGTQWAHPNFISDGTHTDAWCQNPQNVVPPALSMQAHTAPLDILFYPGGSFPADTVGDAFITFHGSWNASPAVGRSVMRVPFGANGMPSGSEVPILETSGSNVNNFPHRPVGLAVSKQGMLYVTSDSTDRVIAIGHDGT